MPQLDERKEDFIIKPPDYKEAVKTAKEIYIQFYYLSPEVESSLVKILHRFLERYDLLYMKDVLYTVLKELINNAIKANIKRIYFQAQGLTIDDKDAYRTGMEKFKEDTYGNDSKYDFSDLKKEKMLVRVSFIAHSDKMIFHVINNVPILDEEIAKIEARVKKAYKYNDISEAFDDVLDDSEGAGLGLIMALMLFKNIGLPAETFHVSRKNNLTVAAIRIPQMIDRAEIHTKITDEIMKEIENIPSFPTSIKEIQRILSNPESTIKEISDNIKRDPALTANIMKIANSAGYITIKRVDTIEEAVKKIGTKGINTLLVASGVQDILEIRYKKYEKLWKNSYKTAFYAQRLAVKLDKAQLVEYVYLSALLTDIGRIVLLSLKPDLAKRIKDIVGSKGSDELGIFEEIGIGMSHSTLGSVILKKWNFNEAVTSVVELHHRPHLAPEKYRELIYIVYLASAMLDIEERKGRYEMMDEDVLELFNLTVHEDFNSLHNDIKTAYEEHAAE